MSATIASSLRRAHLTPEHQRAARAKVRPESNVANGRKGHEACVRKYGTHYAARRIAAWRREHHTGLMRTVCGWLDQLWHIPECEVEIVPGKVYADIVLRVGDRRLIVECDSETFHTNDPLHGEDRVARERERDALILAAGYELLHLREREINDGSGRTRLVAFIEGALQ